MKKVAVLFLTGATMVATSAQADTLSQDVREVTDDGVHAFNTFKPAGVRAEVGTQGFGAALVYSASPSVDVEVGYAKANKLDIVKDKEIGSLLGDEYNGIKADVSFEPKQNAYLNAKLRPFKNNFHVTTGVLWQDNDLSATLKGVDSGTVTINGKEYHPNSVGTFKVDIDFKNQVAPYLGIGFSPSITNRWGLFGEVGAAYVGSYDVNVTSSKNPNEYLESTVDGKVYKLDGSLLPNGKPLERKQIGDITNEIRDEISDKGISAGVLPVAKVGVTFRF